MTFNGTLPNPALAPAVGARDPPAAHGHGHLPGERQARHPHRAGPVPLGRADLPRLAADRRLPQRRAALVDRRVQRQGPERARHPRRDRRRLRQPPAILSISEDGKFLSAKTGPAPDRARRRDLRPRDPNVNQITVGRAASQLPQAGCDERRQGRLAARRPARSDQRRRREPAHADDRAAPAARHPLDERRLPQRHHPDDGLRAGPAARGRDPAREAEDRNTCPNDALRFYIQASASDGYASLLSWGDISTSYGNRRAAALDQRERRGAHHRAARALPRRRARRPLRLGNAGPHRRQGHARGLPAKKGC